MFRTMTEEIAKREDGIKGSIVVLVLRGNQKTGHAFDDGFDDLLVSGLLKMYNYRKCEAFATAF